MNSDRFDQAASGLPSPPMRRVGKMGLTLLLGIGAALLGAAALSRHVGSDLASAVVLAALVVAAYVFGVRRIEAGRIPELSHPGGGARVMGGVVLGVGLFAIVMGVLWLAGVYHAAGGGSAAALGAGAAAAIVTAILEETLFRGLLYRMVSALGGTWVALVITSALFGAAHAFNPGATLVSSVAISLEAGVLLGAAYAATGDLWLPIGLHAGWNFGEASLFGMTESGATPGRALLSGALRGPRLLTGGAFGPEASVVAVAVCLVAAGILLVRAAQLGRIEPRMWRRGRSGVHGA